MSHSCTQRSLVGESTEVEEECICCLSVCLLVSVGTGVCRDRQNYATYHLTVLARVVMLSVCQLVGVGGGVKQNYAAYHFDVSIV